MTAGGSPQLTTHMHHGGAKENGKEFMYEAIYKSLQELTPAEMIERNKISTEIYQEIQAVDAIYEEEVQFFNRKDWKKARLAALERDGEIDVWEYMKTGRIQPGICVHHIISRREAPDRVYDLTNLITVSKESHREIEKLYSKGNKKLLQQRLLAEAGRRTEAYLEYQRQMAEAEDKPQEPEPEPKDSLKQLTIFDLEEISCAS